MGAGHLAGGLATERRAANLLDGGAPFYDLYETADGRHLAVGALEPQFYDALLDGLGLRETAPDRDDPANHPALRDAVRRRPIRSRTLAEWTEVFDGSDACVAPVLPLSEAVHHPHLAARAVYVDRGAGPEPAPAPRFSRTAATLGVTPAARGPAPTPRPPSPPGASPTSTPCSPPAPPSRPDYPVAAQPSGWSAASAGAGMGK